MIHAEGTGAHRIEVHPATSPTARRAAAVLFCGILSHQTSSVPIDEGIFRFKESISRFIPFKGA